MILYHGSRQIVEYPEIRKAKYNKELYEIRRAGKKMGSTLWCKWISE